MPRFELRDPFGNFFGCHTSDPDVAGGWLLEHARLAVNTNAAVGPWYLTIWPLFPDGRLPDWPIEGTRTGVERQVSDEQMHKLAELLEHLLGK